MILFTSGFPKSGKTTFAKFLIEGLGDKHVLHINPEDYYPDNMQDLPKEEKTAVATTAWEMCLERATKAIFKLPDKVLIIFDTCCSKSFYMRPLFMNAKSKGHRTKFIYINTPLIKRVERSGDASLADLEERYKSSFKEALPSFNILADEVTIIKNDGSLQELDKHAQIVCDKIGSAGSD